MDCFLEPGPRPFLSLVLAIVFSPFKGKARLEAEIIMLRHQLNVLRRSVPSKPKLGPTDRLFFTLCLLKTLKCREILAIAGPQS